MSDTKIASAYSFYETEAGAEASGVWIDVGPFKFKLARAGGANEEFMKVATKRLKPFASNLDQLPKKAADELAIGIFVDTILIDWQGVGDRDGVALPYSKENAKQLLIDLPNLFVSLQAEANKMSNFTKTALEDASKN